MSRTNVAQKLCQVLQVKAPEYAEPDIARMNLNGLMIMGRILFNILHKSAAGHPKEASIYSSDGKFQGRATLKARKTQNAKNFTSKIINLQEAVNASNLSNQQQPHLPFATQLEKRTFLQ